jgi:hypothetical protein
MNYSAINIQGNIISSEILEKIRTEDIRFQKPSDFNLPPNTNVRDEINLAWSLAVSNWNVFKAKRDALKDSDSGTSETRKYWMLPLLGILGYETTTANAEIINDKSYAISHRATNKDGFPIHIIGVNQSMDKRPETGGTRLSPHALAQEYINNVEHLYALVSNGSHLRLVRDATRLSRLSYLEFNLEQIMDEGLYVEFALLYRALHASRMPVSQDQGADSILEFYHQEAIASGTRIRERLSTAVEQSIRELANGFLHHPHNEHLREQIESNKLDAKQYYFFTLRLVYRILFLLVIEERKLIYAEKLDEATTKKRSIYYDFYSLQRLTKLATKLVYVDPKKTDLWQSLLSTFALFEHGKYGSVLGIAPLGAGLFAPDALGVISHQVLDNECLLKVLCYLVTFENENKQQVRVNYADLDVEEFGSVYEGLLEYDPLFTDNIGQPVFSFVKGDARSSSGSHYTPEELVKPLIKHSLDYLIEDKLKENDKEAGLLSLNICDVACGSGHILLSAARRIGWELACLREAKATGQSEKVDQPTPTILRTAVRDVIKNCIYGVDLNPLAVELCKVALWLEAHAPGEPLNFLDHHIKCGDAIVGLAHRSELEKGIADEAFKTLEVDDKDIAKAWRDKNVKERKERIAKSLQLKAEFEKSTENSVQEAMAEYKTFNQLPETTPDEIERKAKAYKKFIDGKGFTFLKAMADTQVAQFFIPKTEANKDLFITDGEFRRIMSGYGGWTGKASAKAAAVASEQRFFHWFIEFPEVFVEGGFDCILGNPPYLGGSKISGHYGNAFLNYLKTNYSPSPGLTDLVAYFVRRNFQIIIDGGFNSIITTNSVYQGDSREASLEYLIGSGSAKINFAIRAIKWPGQAKLTVALIVLNKNYLKAKPYLDNSQVNFISSFLDSQIDFSPIKLNQSLDKCFIGSSLLGDGFLINEETAIYYLSKDDKYKKVVFPIFNGDDINNLIELIPQRYVVYFWDWSENELKKYLEIADLIKDAVIIERSKTKQSEYIKTWWKFKRATTKIYRNNDLLKFCITSARTTKYLSFTISPSNAIYTDGTVIITDDSYKTFSVYHSTLHSEWAFKLSSALATTLRYAPSDCFETFPFPQNLIQERQLETIGEAYHEHRRQLMLGMQLGLTKTYNLFHCNAITAQSINDKDKQVVSLQKHLEKTANTISFDEAIEGILKLRELHVQMDKAVLDAYGWNDIELKHNFYDVDYLPENDRVRFTIHTEARKEVLKRLLELNHKIHEEEVAKGLWDKKGGKNKGYKTPDDNANIVEEPDENLGGLFNQE